MVVLLSKALNHPDYTVELLSDQQTKKKKIVSTTSFPLKTKQVFRKANVNAFMRIRIYKKRRYSYESVGLLLNDPKSIPNPQQDNNK